MLQELLADPIYIVSLGIGMLGISYLVAWCIYKHGCNYKMVNQ